MKCEVPKQFLNAGVVGLCSVVSACPYEIPPHLPAVLMVLADHLHDPQPISGTVKLILQDFKRTHQDNWAEHKVSSRMGLGGGGDTCEDASSRPSRPLVETVGARPPMACLVPSTRVHRFYDETSNDRTYNDNV